MESLKLTVRWLLLFAVEELLGAPNADLPLDLELSTLSRADFGALRAADRVAADGCKVLDAVEARDCRELQWAHRKLAAAMLRDLRSNGLLRIKVALKSRHLPTEMKQWGRKQAKRIGDKLAKGERPDGFAIAYLALSLESAIAHEAAHEPEWQDPSALAEVQREYVEWHTLAFDSGANDVPAKKRRAIPGAE